MIFTVIGKKGGNYIYFIIAQSSPPAEFIATSAPYAIDEYGTSTVVDENVIAVFRWYFLYGMQG
jgi:hypothetical protein